MGVTYKATINIKCWKRHECVGCGGQYRYKFARTVTGEAGSESAAGKAAEKAAIATVEKDVDQRPCPRCGCVQPDMIAQQKSNRHFWVALLLLLFSAAAGLCGLISSATWMTYSSASLLLAVASAAGLVVHAAVALSDPNKNKDANRDRAERMVDQGDMEPVADADDDLAGGEPKPVAGAAFPLLGLAALGVVLTTVPFVLKTVSRWPTVADTKPEVAGPGDKLTVYFPKSFESVKGYWSGSPRVTVTNDGGAGPLSIPATAKADSWGNTISGKSVSNSRPAAWAELALPNDPKLAGKTIEVRVDMTVQYPHGTGRSFDNQTTQLSQTAKFTLAGSGAGGTYYASMWAAVLGAILVAVAGFSLMVAANGLRKYAAPAEVTPIKGRRTRDDEEDDDEPRRDRRRVRDRDADEDDDEEDDRRDRRRSRRDDDEDDRPPRRRDDDEDDDRPRRRYDR